MPKFAFPIWLQGTPAQQQAEAERQALAVAAHGRGHLTEAERLIGRGELLEKTARGNLEATGENEEARTLALSQLADALALQGRFTEAAETHPDPVRTEYFESIVDAIQMDDGERCPCPDTTAEIDGVEIAVTPRFEREKIFSPLHGETVSLIECSKCGHLNARQPVSRLLPQQSALAQSEAAGRPVMTDKELLRTDAATRRIRV